MHSEKKKYTIHFKANRDLEEEDLRMISFISEDIQEIRKNGERDIEIIVDNLIDEDTMLQKINEVFQRVPMQKNSIYTSCKNRVYCDDNLIEDSGIIRQYGKGLLSLDLLGVKLINCIDELLVEMLKDESIIYKKYPTLLPIEILEKTKYLETSPQYIYTATTFRENFDDYKKIPRAYQENQLLEFSKEAEYTLSPSACFHLYKELENKTMTTEQNYSMCHNVFRNEGRLNWNEKTRLRDYHVREIVFIGAHDYVIDFRKRLIEKTINLMERLELNFSVDEAEDAFVIPKMQIYKKIQRLNKVKYELNINYNEEKKVACGSFNLHGISFSDRFNFCIENVEKTESGCIGFGLERLMLCFLKQHGTDITKWPEIVKEKIMQR